MLFNSSQFLFFLPIVFLLYWFVFQRNLKAQNLFIVVVSYIFYGWWDWRFLILIAFTSACSFLSGIAIERAKNTPPLTNRAKLYAIANIIVNLVVLGVFKYFNFFCDNFARLFELFGAEPDWVTLEIMLPVGISFYTFQALSYTIDVYRENIASTKSAVNFFAYVSFFPQLVAGPIERATTLLPQFEQKRHFDYDMAVDGCRQMLWGFFKKLVIADMCATGVNNIFDGYTEVGSVTLVLGAFLFTFQIYGDFSGYSDIAIGCSKIFGIKLMRNFNIPYFSRDIAEFWRKWHISLTTWFRDYLYIPLGGSRGGKGKVIRNTFIIFLVSGLWHGANWTYIAWGGYHALLFIPLLLTNSNRQNQGIIAEDRILPNLKEVGSIIYTFILVTIGWVIFRADSISQAGDYLFRIVSEPWFADEQIRDYLPLTNMRFLLYAVPILIVVEWVSRRRSHPFDFNNNTLLRYKVVRWIIYYLFAIYLTYSISAMINAEAQQFIYFQF